MQYTHCTAHVKVHVHYTQYIHVFVFVWTSYMYSVMWNGDMEVWKCGNKS